MEAAGDERAGRWGWLVVVGAFGLLGVLQVIGVLVLLVSGFRGWLGAAMAALGAIGCYWFAAGAWLRTPPGRLRPRQERPPEPELSERRARRYMLISVAIVVALMLALSFQAIRGGW